MGGDERRNHGRDLGEAELIDQTAWPDRSRMVGASPELDEGLVPNRAQLRDAIERVLK